MRWPLRNQILVPFAAVTVATVVVVSGLNVMLAARRSEQQITRQLHDVAEIFRTASFPLSEAVLKQAHGLSGAELVVVDNAGRVQAASRMTPEHLVFANLPPTSSGWGPTVDLAGERYFHNAVKARLQPGDGDSVYVHILYPERIWRDNRREATVPPLLVGGATLAVVILAAVMLAQRLSRPLDLLRSQVGRIAEGDFQLLPLPRRNDELRDLVASVNTMSERLNQLTQGLKRNERLALLGQLSGGLAHHLRNDITGAKMAVQLHQRSCSGSDSQSLTVALRQLALTEDHLQQFLAVGQPRAPRRVACDLRDVIVELVRLAEPTARHRKVRLQFVGDDSPLPLRAEPDQLRQMLLNLVLNAIDAAGNGGWVRIETSRDTANDALRVRVLDSGPGPPAEIRARLFEPFVTGKPEGIGLGLAAARQIAETHGGGIYFSSTNGTCFEVVLPCNFLETPHDQPT